MEILGFVKFFVRVVEVNLVIFVKFCIVFAEFLFIIIVIVYCSIGFMLLKNEFVMIVLVMIVVGVVIIFSNLFI